MLIVSVMHRWLATNPDNEGVSLALTTWSGRGWAIDEFGLALFEKFLREASSLSASWLLKIIVKLEEIPIPVCYAILAWCVRFPDHEDTLARLHKIVGREGVASKHVVFSIAWVLVESDVDEIVTSPFRLASARKCLVDLFVLSWDYPFAMLLANFYFKAWFRSGKVFVPANLSGWYVEEVPNFDQLSDIISMLAALVESGDIGKSESVHLSLFKEWVMEWVRLEDRRVIGAMRRLGIAVEMATSNPIS
jgi:hypothetical protein